MSMSEWMIRVWLSMIDWTIRVRSWRCFATLALAANPSGPGCGSGAGA